MLERHDTLAAESAEWRLLALFTPGCGYARWRQLLENLLAAAAYDVPSAAVFVGDAAHLLSPAEDPELHRLRAPFSSLPLYEVDPIIRIEASLVGAPGSIALQDCNSAELANLLAVSRWVVTP